MLQVVHVAGQQGNGWVPGYGTGQSAGFATLQLTFLPTIKSRR